MEMIQDDLEAMFRGVKGITHKRRDDEVSDQVEPLTEPDDMVIVASPRHSYEPVKVPEDHTGRCTAWSVGRLSRCKQEAAFGHHAEPKYGSGVSCTLAQGSPSSTEPWGHSLARPET